MAPNMIREQYVAYSDTYPISFGPASILELSAVTSILEKSSQCGQLYHNYVHCHETVVGNDIWMYVTVTTHDLTVLAHACFISRQGGNVWQTVAASNYGNVSHDAVSRLFSLIVDVWGKHIQSSFSPLPDETHFWTSSECHALIYDRHTGRLLHHNHIDLNAYPLVRTSELGWYCWYMSVPDIHSSTRFPEYPTMVYTGIDIYPKIISPVRDIHYPQLPNFFVKLSDSGTARIPAAMAQYYLDRAVPVDRPSNIRTYLFEGVVDGEIRRVVILTDNADRIAGCVLFRSIANGLIWQLSEVTRYNNGLPLHEFEVLIKFLACTCGKSIQSSATGLRYWYSLWDSLPHTVRLYPKIYDILNNKVCSPADIDMDSKNDGQYCWILHDRVSLLNNSVKRVLPNVTSQLPVTI